MKKLSLVLISIFSVLLCGLLTACGKTFEVKFTESDCIVAIGEEINLDSLITIKNGNKKDVEFKFSNPALFSVQGKTAKAENCGKGYIYAYHKSQNLASKQVIVKDKFASPTGFNVENERLLSQDGKLKWNAVSGAFDGKVYTAKYEISGTCDGQPIFDSKKILDKNEFDFSEVENKQGKYELEIKAAANDYFVESDVANVTIYYNYALPATNISWQNGVISWQKEEDYTYQVIFDGKKIGDFADISTLDISNEFKTKQDGKSYEVKIISHSPNGELLDRESEAITIEKLNVPTISFGDGQMQLENAKATSFSLILETGEEVLYENSSLKNVTAGNHQVKAVAKNLNGLYFESSPSEAVSIFKLDKLQIEYKSSDLNGQILKADVTSSSAPFATTFVINGLENVTQEGFVANGQNKSIEIPISQSGNYNISVYQKTNLEQYQGAYIISGDPTEEVTISKFEKITNFAHSYDFENKKSIITFANVGAENYEIRKSDGTLIKRVDGTDDETVRVELDTYLEDLISDNEIKIVALANEKLSIGSSETVSFVRIAQIQTKPRENTSFAVEWNEVDNANGYLVEYHKFSSKQEYDAFENDVTFEVLSEIVYATSFEFLEEGYYYFSVKALPQNTNQFLSSSKNQQKLFVSKTVEFGTLKFKFDENEITDERSGYYLEITPQAEGHVESYTFSGTNLTISSKEDGNRYYIGKIQAGEYNLTITANSNDEQVYLAATKTLNLQKLTTATYADLNVDEAGTLLKVASKTGESETIIKNNNPDEQTVNGEYTLPKQDEINLLITRKGTIEENGEFNISEKIYLDSEIASLKLKRVARAENLKYDSASKQICLTAKSIANRKFWVLDIIGENAILNVKLDTTVVITLNGEQFTVEEDSDYIHEDVNDVKIEIGKILKYIKTQDKLLDFYTQENDLSFAVYAHQNRELNDCLEISSLYAVAESNPSQYYIKIPKLPASTLSFNKETMNLEWTDVSQDAAINSKTTYSLYYQKNEEKEQEIQHSTSNYNLVSQNFEFDAGATYKFYVKATNPEFLDESVSNEIYLQKLRQISTLTLNENNLIFTILDDKTHYSEVKFVYNDEEESETVNGSSVAIKGEGSYKFSIVGTSIGDTYYYLDSEESVWTVSKMGKLVEKSPVSVTFNGNVITFTKFPTSISSLQYLIRFTDKNNYSYSITTKDLSIDLSQNEEILNEISKLSAGKIKIGVYASLGTYSVSLGNVIYYADNIEGVGYNYYSYIANSLEKEIEKFATPEIENVEFVYQNKSEQPKYLEDAQIPQIKVTFKGNYGEGGKFKIFVGENEVTTSVSYQSGDDGIGLYAFILKNSDYANAGASGKVKISIYALNIEDNASAIPSSAGLLIIDKAQTFSGISFEEMEKGYLTENLLLNYSKDAPQPLDGIVLKIEYTPLSSEKATKYLLASEDLDLNEQFKVSLAEFIATNLKDGGTIDKISAFVNSGAKNKAYVLAGEIYETQQPFKILKQAKQDNIQNVSEGFKISPDFNSENTIYKVTVTTEGSSGVYYLSADNEFTFTFPDIWSDNTYHFTIEAFESGKVCSAISDELSISLTRIEQITKSSITLTRGADNQLSLSWTGVSEAKGYIINVYAQKEQDKELVYSFNTAEHGNKINYKVEEIFGVGYINLIQSGMTFIENQNIVLGFVTVGSTKQNSKELFVNSQIKGNSILENNINVDEFGVLYFDTQINETYLYKIEGTNVESSEWKSEFSSGSVIKVNTDELEEGKSFNITIVTKGGVDSIAVADQANFVFDSASYTTAETGYTFSKTDKLRVLQDENLPQNLNFSVVQADGLEMYSKIKDGAKIFVGASETDLSNAVAVEVKKEVSLSGDVVFGNIPEIVASLQNKINSEKLYFWLLNQTISKDQTFVSSIATTFTIKLDKSPINYKVLKGKYMQGDQVLTEDYINTFVTLENTDSSSINTQGFYIKITQLEAEEEFTIFKFISKEKLLNKNYFNDNQLSSKVFENNFVINLTEIFDGKELLDKSGKFSISLLKIYKNDNVCVISDWTEINKTFSRLAEITNLGLNLGNITWRGNGDCSYVVYFYAVDKAHESFDPSVGFNYDTLILYKYFLTDYENFNPSSFMGEQDRYFIAVRAINKENINILDEYVLSSGRVFTLEQGIPSYHYKNAVKTPLALDKTGRLSFAWKEDDDFIEFLKTANGEGDAIQLATSTFTMPFTFTLADLDRETFLFKFVPYSEPNGFTYEVQVKAIDLLDDYTKTWEDAKTRLNTLSAAPKDTNYREIISNFISAIENASKGVGYDQKLFDAYFEKVQKGDYKLMYCLQGNSRRFNSGWYTFQNKDKEDKLYVNEEPNVKVVQVNSLSDATITDDAINAYKVIIKKAKIYGKGGSLQAADIYRMVLGTNTFIISLSAKSVQLESEDGNTVMLYNCDANGVISTVESEYVMFYLNYTDKSLLAIYGEKVYRTSYTMQIYVVGNEYSAASKSEEFKIFFLDLNSLSVKDGEIIWNASDARPVTIFAKHESSVDTNKFTEREKFSLEKSKEGQWDLRLVVKGEVVNNDVYVDTDIYKLSVYKLEAPTITTKLGNLVIANSSKNIDTLKNAATTEKDLFKYRLFNDRSTAINYITIYKNDESAFEYEAGLAGIEEDNSQYVVKESEREASIFYAMAIGSTVNLKIEDSEEKKGYYDKTLKPDDEVMQDKMVVLSSANTPKDAKMLDDINQKTLKIENGVITWDAVASKGASVSENIVYKVTLETYTKSTVGNNTTETTTGSTVSYYTANTSFDIAFVDEISLPDEEETFIKVTVQALSANAISLEDGQTVPQESKKYALVEGGAYLDVSSQNTYKDEENYVLMSDRVSLKDIERLDAIEEIEIAIGDEGKSAGYLTWRYKANGIETVEEFKEQIGFEVYDDQYNFVHGEFDIKKVDDEFVVVFKDSDMKAGKFTVHVYVTQGEGNNEKLIKSYPTDIEITKLAKITENDYEVNVQSDGREELSFEKYFEINENKDNIIIVSWNDTSVTLKKDGQKTIEITNGSDETNSKIVLEDNLEITFKVVRDISSDQANLRNKILFSGESTVKFARPKWGEQDQITWNDSEQRYEWVYSGDGNDSEDLTFYVEIKYNSESDIRTYVTKNSYFTPTVIGTIERFSVKAKINNSSVLSVELVFEQEKQFNLFNSGEGTKENPYIIDNEDQFKNIRYRLTKDDSLNNYTKIVNSEFISQIEEKVYYFKLAANLTFEEVEGFVISGQFNGVLDGQNGESSYTITFTSKNVKQLALQIEDNNSYRKANYNYATALFENLFNEAEIKNINIKALFQRDSNLNVNALMAGLAITNWGQVTNVNVVGFESNFNSSIGSGQIASMAFSGLVAYNLGSISGCKVLTSISLQDKSTTAQNIYLAGISYINAGTITYCTTGKATETHAERFEFRVDLTAATSSVHIAGITIISTKTIQNCVNECVIVANGTASDQAAYLAGISIQKNGTFTSNTNNYSTYIDQAGDTIQNPRVTGSGFEGGNYKTGDVYCE